MIGAEYHLMLSSVYASSPALLSPSRLIAAKHVHDGGLSTGWIVAIVIGLALVTLLVYTSSSGHPGSDESEPDEQTLPPNELVQRLEFPRSRALPRYMLLARAEFELAKQGCPT